MSRPASGLEEPLPGLVAVGLGATVSDLGDGMFLGITADRRLFVASAGVRAVIDLGVRREELLATTWRGDGGPIRRQYRVVPGFATLGSLALGRDVRLVRGYRSRAGRWGVTGPRLLIDGAWLRPAEVEALLPPADAPRNAAVARVADVRALYGRMLTDVAYRIENSALFDSSVALTSRFETALAAWSDLSDVTPAEELVRCSAAVQVSFDAARANPETLGIGHLPETARDDARRAAGAARLAANAGTEAERVVAHATVVRILSSLGLYYLPAPTRLQVED